MAREGAGKTAQHRRGTIDAYLRTRGSLRAVALVMDARHPLREFDRMMLEFAQATGRHALCLLTKSDKLSRSESARVLSTVRKELETFAPVAKAQLFSSLKGTFLSTKREAHSAGWLFGDDESESVSDPRNMSRWPDAIFAGALIVARSKPMALSTAWSRPHSPQPHVEPFPCPDPPPSPKPR